MTALSRSKWTPPAPAAIVCLLVLGGCSTHRVAVVQPASRSLVDAGDSLAARPVATVLLYHRFAEPPAFAVLRGRDRLYTVSTAEFERQLDWLHDRGYCFVTLHEAVDIALRRATIKQPSVLITIDDGCRSVLTRAAPLLRARGIPAALFVTTDPAAYVFRIRTDEDQLTPAELCRLQADGFEIGAHGATHRPMRDMNDSQLADELLLSRRLLETWIGRPVRTLAVPGNWYDERVLRRVGEAGYTAVFTSDRGVIRPGCDSMKLPRINVSGNWTMDQFIENVARVSSPDTTASRDSSRSRSCGANGEAANPASHHPASIR